VENDRVLGQVGVFRLPMISTEGREDVGGVWAVSTHPEYAGQGLISQLLDEAHRRMREAGLRFSTLHTHRCCAAYRLYQQHGYEELPVWGTALARWETAHQPTRLRAQSPDPGGFDLIDTVFADVAAGYLGFAWRHTPFARLRDNMHLDDIWVLWENNQPMGFALTQMTGPVLTISSLLLRQGTDAAEAVAAIAAQINSPYLQVKTSRPCEVTSLRRAGFLVASPDHSAWMVKPLVPDVAVEDARRLFGIGTDRFLISWLDVT
jgi:hypothetical protein